MGVREFLSRYQKIALDTNLFIYAFELNPKYGETVKEIFAAIEDGVVEASASTITLTEILTKPIREGNEMLEKRYRLLFSHFPNLTVVPIDVRVAERAGYLRGKYGIKIADALILSSAIISGAAVFLTNDRRLEMIPDIRTIPIEEIKTQSDGRPT